jgi:ankyrin repeat protein
MHKNIKIVSLIAGLSFIILPYASLHAESKDNSSTGAVNKNKVKKNPLSMGKTGVKEETGKTALMIAAESGDKETVGLLLSKGADVNAKDAYDRTALIFAVGSGNDEIAELLISKGADINAKNSMGETALAVAAFYGRKETAELLISKGVDVNIKDNYNNTALMTTVYLGNDEIAELLISKGADVNIKDTRGTVLKSRFSGINSIIDTILDPNNKNGYWQDVSPTEVRLKPNSNIKEGDVKEIAKDDFDKIWAILQRVLQGKTALIFAAERGNNKMVELLISKGADINAKDEEGRTALMSAAFYGRKETVNLLISNGADANTKDNYNNTALMIAASAGNKGMVELLLSKGADVNAKDTRGTITKSRLSGIDSIKGTIFDPSNRDGIWEDASLTEAQLKSNIVLKEDTVRKIAKDDFDKIWAILQRVLQGKTALIFAAEAGNKEIAELLLSKGADINAQDDEGKTALMSAAFYGRKETVNLLISKGADVNTKDNKGETALMKAESRNKGDIVQSLKQPKLNKPVTKISSSLSASSVQQKY